MIQGKPDKPLSMPYILQKSTFKRYNSPQLCPIMLCHTIKKTKKHQETKKTQTKKPPKTNKKNPTTKSPLPSWILDVTKRKTPPPGHQLKAKKKEKKKRRGEEKKKLSFDLLLLYPQIRTRQEGNQLTVAF